MQLTSCKNEGEGSVVVEVGSEHCDSEGHDTDIENAHDLNAPNKDQIETLKELLKKQGRASLLTWLQQTLLDACCVKINGNDLFKPAGGSLEPVPFHFNCKYKEGILTFRDLTRKFEFCDFPPNKIES